jgi:RNA-directed DNA polymerase
MRGDLLEKTASLSTLLQATLRAARKCPYSQTRATFLLHIDRHCLHLREQLLAGTYCWGPYESTIVVDPKRRVIHKAPFRDRVVHQAMADVLNPILERFLIHTTYACRFGKGTDTALKAAIELARRHEFAVKMDISKYFASVNHSRLLEKLRRIVPNGRYMALLESLVLSFSPGIPIGNLTSQLFANLYLNDLDQFIKRDLKVKYYLRYMDDMLFFLHDKETAWRLVHAVREKAALDALTFPARKVQLYRTRSGVNFLGYRIFNTGRPRMLSRKLRRLREKLRAAAKSAHPKKARQRTISGWYGSARYGLSPRLCTDLGIADDVAQWQ